MPRWGRNSASSLLASAASLFFSWLLPIQSAQANLQCPSAPTISLVATPASVTPADGKPVNVQLTGTWSAANFCNPVAGSIAVVDSLGGPTQYLPVTFNQDGTFAVATQVRALRGCSSGARTYTYWLAATNQYGGTHKASSAVATTYLPVKQNDGTSPTVAPMPAPWVLALQFGQGSPALTPAGMTTQLSTTGIYSNGTVAALTSGQAWSSANAATATVSSSGLVTGVFCGQVKISASIDAATSSVTVAVPCTTPFQLDFISGAQNSEIAPGQFPYPPQPGQNWSDIEFVLGYSTGNSSGYGVAGILSGLQNYGVNEGNGWFFGDQLPFALSSPDYDLGIQFDSYVPTPGTTLTISGTDPGGAAASVTLTLPAGIQPNSTFYQVGADSQLYTDWTLSQVAGP